MKQKLINVGKRIRQQERRDVEIGRGEWEAQVIHLKGDSIMLKVRGITNPRTIVLQKGDTLHLTLPPVTAQIGGQSFTIDVAPIEVTYE